LIDEDTVAAHLGVAARETAVAGTPDFAGALDHWIAAENPRSGDLYDDALAAFERPLFEHALRETSGNQLQAARLLGINRNTLRKRLGELGIEADRFNRRD
jgi:two-component system nitrogen regulation response regulator GlnG